MNDNLNPNSKYSVSICDKLFNFEWPETAIDSIMSIFISQNKVYVSSSPTLCLYHTEDKIYASDTETTICIGDVVSADFAIRSGKTNLKPLKVSK